MSLDFVQIARVTRRDSIDIKPKFLVNPETEDLMIKGGDFYAVWDEKRGLWSEKEGSVIKQIDRMIDQAAEDAEKMFPGATINRLHMRDSDSGSIDKWHKYVQKQMRDHYEILNQKIIFSNTPVKKEDYASIRLPYACEEGSIDAWTELIGTLYDREEREKLEWAIGAIVSGDAKRIEKFEVLYGESGSGKSTFLKILKKMFDGYCNTFNAKALGSASNAFSLESFKNNPIVSIQFDGDLSKIEDNTKINSIVSHEEMELNAKYTKLYTTKFNTFLFMGTNKPVKITEAKSGLLRRLIDVKPSGKKVSFSRYNELRHQVEFEFGAITYHCLKVYEQLGETYYDNYVPVEMMAATNDFFDFMEHEYDYFDTHEKVSLTDVYNRYKEYCTYANSFQMPLRAFRAEFANYFKHYEEKTVIDGVAARSIYSGFRREKFEIVKPARKIEQNEDSWLKFDHAKSIFDDIFGDCPAQYADENGNPRKKWANVTTKLSEIDTTKLHWVKPPQTLVTFDFDICDESGKKSFELNKKAASKFPKTYAELSKGGSGIHLEYYYDGDVSKVSSVFGDNVEVKTYTGNSSLRRRLTKCNDIPIATLTSGLPQKGEKKVVYLDGIKNEEMLRALITNNLRKKYHPDTSSSINFIVKILDEAYESGMEYDVSDMLSQVLAFAMGSTNQKERCVDAVATMKFASEKQLPSVPSSDDAKLTFFDIEVYRPDEATGNPGLFLVVWKFGKTDEFNVLINPKPYEIEAIVKSPVMLLVGFNNRSYDNHMLYGSMCGYSNERLYKLSQDIISGQVGAKFGSAYNISYTDVYDFATEKKSLKKWEIELGIHHQEMGIPWDEPAPKEMWSMIIEYCKNDVMATEAVFWARQGDFMARKIQVDLVRLLHGDEIKVTVNDTTNTLSKRIIFGSNTEPQSAFNYRDMSRPVGSDQYETYRELFGPDYRFRVFDDEGLPLYRDYVPGEVLPDGYSILPFFKGYEFDQYKKKDKSVYLGEVIGEGGRVYSVKGVYLNVWDGDISSQHPHSIIAECLFGPKYTKIFEDIVEARVAIKHKDFEKAGSLLGGALKPYLNDENAKDLAQALKIVINSIYGLTKAGFKNEFRDPRNLDNIVAKRGALFMTLLKREVEKRGAMVCHIKTDSIKIPNCSNDIQQFVIRFGREFGYEFETEGVFKKFCLLNDAAYIAQCEDGSWITKATQFNKDSNPYVYKTLFSHEVITFEDMCETKSVSAGALYLDMNQNLGEPIDHEYEKALDRLAKLRLKGASDIDIRSQEDVVERLRAEVPTHHNYQFVGRVGQFTPVDPEKIEGGILYRKQDERYYAAPGTTGYRWLESEYLRSCSLLDVVDRSYYTRLVDQAIKDIEDACIESGFTGGYEWFVSPLSDFMNIPEGAPEEVPFEELKGE